MSMKKWGVIFIISVLAAGCNTLPTKQQTPNLNLTTQEHLDIASQDLANWEELNDKAALSSAVIHLEAALRNNPQHPAIQTVHYKKLLEETWRVRHKITDELKSAYSRLHPHVKNVVLAPSVIDYLNALVQRRDAKELTDILKKVISVQPRNAHVWNMLSEHYSDQKKHWLAAAAAKQAHQLRPETPAYNYQLGLSIADITLMSDCHYDEKELAKRSISYLNKAVVVGKKRLYISKASLLYLRLGLFPLAHHQAKKAYLMEEKRWTATLYAESAIHLNRYDEAKPVVLQMLSKYKNYEAYEILARFAAKDKNWPEAVKQMLNYREKQGNSVLDELRTRWILGLAGNGSEFKDLNQLKADSPWAKTIRDYFVTSTGGESAVKNDFLINQSKNGCQLTEAHFYTAYKYWLQNDKNTAIMYLNKTLDGSAKRYYEYYWAKVLKDLI